MATKGPTKYPHVPLANITSIGFNNFSAGLDQRGEANIAPNAFSVGRNAMVTPQGIVTHRLAQFKWLPDTVNTAYQVYPAVYNGSLYYLTADNGTIKYCQEGDSAWTICGGDNTISTSAGTITTFLRVLNKVAILNGVDNLGYVDLTTMNVVHFNHVNDPTSAPTSSYLTGTTPLTTGPYNLYYCFSYNSIVGKTLSSPIVTVPVNKIREQWATDGSQGITITDPNTRPTGAVSWNVYISEAPAGGTIQLSDMIPLKQGIDISTTSFTDNGQLQQIINSGTAPAVNSTQGPQAKYGVEINGRPFLYGVTNDPYAVMIGGDGVNALDFSEGNGGYRLLLNDGTDYYPSAIVGFRNGQGVPSITVLYSSVSGLSKASIIDQNTVTLGTYSAVTWGSTDQNYGASGVASPYAVVDYLGKLVFPSTDGITSIDTSKLRFNVLTAERISDPVVEDVDSILSNMLGNVVGTAWANRIMFSIPANGFLSNNEIAVYDVTNPDAPCWYTFEMRAQWLGTVSPAGSPGFVYISQDNHFFKLEESYVAQDQLSTGLTQPFPFEVVTGLIGTNEAHNGFFAVVSAVLYARQFIGSLDFTVSWRDYQSGLMVSSTKTFTNGTLIESSVGNWSSPGELYNQAFPTTVLRWGDTDVISNSLTPQKNDLRLRFPLNNVVTNELQAVVSTNLDNSSVDVRSISFEGQSLGVAPDVR